MEIVLCLKVGKETENSPIGFQNKGWPTIKDGLMPIVSAGSKR